MARGLGTNRFQYFRNWLYPGTSGEASAPTQVSEMLSAVVDAERWVPVPRFGVHIQTTGFVGKASVINLEMYDPAGTAFKPNDFCITDLMVQVPYGPDDNGNGVLVQTRRGGDWEEGTALTTAGIQTLVFSGSAPKAVWQWGSALNAGQLNSNDRMYISPTNVDPGLAGGGSSFGYVHIPDIDPGNCIQFRGRNHNEPIELQATWCERRPMGQ